MGDLLLVTEIFYSIQGESTFAGEPCTFVRLTRCDLRCAWCDTQYAFYGGTEMTVDTIIEEVGKHPPRLVEITGGEPLLQKSVHVLIGRLLDRGWKVLVETGGHRDIRPIDPRAVLIYDIKCPDSLMSKRNRWENLPHLRPHDQVKFVLASRSDYDWAKEQLKAHRLHERHTVLFSPVWETLAPRILAEWILEDGLQVRLQVQLHKILWGPDKRGV